MCAMDTGSDVAQMRAAKLKKLAQFVWYNSESPSLSIISNVGLSEDQNHAYVRDMQVAFSELLRSLGECKDGEPLVMNIRFLEQTVLKRNQTTKSISKAAFELPAALPKALSDEKTDGATTSNNALDEAVPFSLVDRRVRMVAIAIPAVMIGGYAIGRAIEQVIKGYFAK